VNQPVPLLDPPVPLVMGTLRMCSPNVFPIRLNMFLGGRVLSLVCMYVHGGSTCSQVDGVLPIHNMYVHGGSTCSQVDGFLPTHKIYVHGGQCVPKWTRSSLPVICMYMGGSICSQVDGVLPIHKIYMYMGVNVFPKWIGSSLYP
jgi:hypothetical protein